MITNEGNYFFYNTGVYEDLTIYADFTRKLYLLFDDLLSYLISLHPKKHKRVASLPKLNYVIVIWIPPNDKWG